MKKIFIAILCLTVLSGVINAQQSSSSSEPLQIAVVAAKSATIPESCMSVMENKMMQILTSNGLGSCNYHTQFLITASVTPVTKDVVPGPPAQYAFTNNITFYIVDNLNKSVFSSITCEAKGVDVSEEKALMNAIRSIRTSTKDFNAFVNTGKEKIIAYYETNGKMIIDKAKKLAGQKKYEEALCLLNSIPMTSSWYESASTVAEPIFVKYADLQSEKNLAAAKSIWYASQNIQGGKDACNYLRLITPELSAYNGAKSLYGEIKKKVGDITEYPWKLHDDDISLESQRINAWREVGIAYGENQQADTNSLMWLIK